MADTPVYDNLARFVPDDGGDALWLRLDGEWTLQAGVKPSVFSAVAAWSEFDKLGGNYDRLGQLQLFFLPGVQGNPNPPAPSLVLKKWRLVDIVPGRFGQIQGGALRHIDYRLGFADRRDDYVYPRGGSLDFGEINKEPFNKNGTQDANGNTTRTVQQMVQWCIDEMKMDVVVPAGLSDVPRMRNVEWRGNNPMEELEKLLEHAGFALVVKTDGTLAIEQLGKGDLPAPAANVIVDSDYPGIDRRGSVVLFSSAPLAIIDKTNYQIGVELEWVVLDVDDQFVTLDKATILKKDAKANGAAIDPKEIIRQDFAQIPEKWRLRVRNYLYCAVRLIKDQYGPQPMMRHSYADVSTSTALLTQLEVTARSIIPGNNGLAVMSGEMVEIPPTQLMDHGRVLVLPYTLGKFQGGLTTGSASDFVPLESGDLQIRVTREVYEKDENGIWKPKFFTIGFKQGLGQQGNPTLVKLSDDEVEAVLNQGRQGYYSKPELRLMREDGNDINRSDLEAVANGMADKYIGGSGTPPTIHAVAGYFAAELSGRVNEISFSMTPPMTSWKVMSWFFPHDIPETKRDKRGDKKLEKFPRQAVTQEKRTAEGIAGASQPVMPLQPGPKIVQNPHGVCRIDSSSADGAGKYNVTLINGATTIVKDTEFKLLDGMTDGAQALAINLAEVTVPPDPVHSALGVLGSHWIVFQQAKPTYANYEYVGTLADGRAIVTIGVANPHALFPVVLTLDGGSDGDASNPATWTYTCRSLGNDVLATNRGPRKLRDIGPAARANEGIGYFDYEKVFQLLEAFELHGSGDCS